MQHKDSIISSSGASVKADLHLGQQPALTENFKFGGKQAHLTRASVGAEPTRQVFSIYPRIERWFSE